MPSRYFLDTSALVARFMTKATGYAWVEHLCDPSSQNEVALADITGAELAAALNQLARGGVIRKRRCDLALAAFWLQVAQGEYYIVPITSAVVRRAADLCSVHSLRGYDAIQLACALTYRDDARFVAAGNPGAGLGDPIFLTEDSRLSTAAAAEGFTVDSPLNHPQP